MDGLYGPVSPVASRRQVRPGPGARGSWPLLLARARIGRLQALGGLQQGREGGMYGEQRVPTGVMAVVAVGDLVGAGWGGAMVPWCHYSDTMAQSRNSCTGYTTLHYGHTRYYVTLRPYTATLMENSTGMV